MKDLLLHTKDAFVPLGQTTDNVKEIAAQAFSFLFMTELGSVKLEPDLGTHIKFGIINMTGLALKSQQAVDTIFATMKVPYNLTAINILSLEEDEDCMKLSVSIESDTFATVLTFNI